MEAIFLVKTTVFSGSLYFSTSEILPMTPGFALEYLLLTVLKEHNILDTQQYKTIMTNKAGKQIVRDTIKQD
jgi:hypothetical protein